jgi:hypothetical protein
MRFSELTRFMLWIPGFETVFGMRLAAFPKITLHDHSTRSNDWGTLFLLTVVHYPADCNAIM